MSEDFVEGMRVKHPGMWAWGIGQVISVDTSSITVFFEVAGEKKLRTDLVDLDVVDGSAAASLVLDAKFKKRRKAKKAFEGSEYFNDGKNPRRKQFIQSLGGTCTNWNWSWSFVNHVERKIFFGAWKDHISGHRARIFSRDWGTRRGRVQNGWPESREHLRLVEEEGYSLYVYTMLEHPNSESDYEKGARKIGAILNDIAEAKLARDGSDWYAVIE